MLSVSSAFLHYLNEEAPSLFYQISDELDILSFRWEIPTHECAIGFTSPRSGIDMIEDLFTRRLCGFTGVHFPGGDFLERVASRHPGPYSPLFIISELELFLSDHGQTLGQYLETIREHARVATQDGCVLRFVTHQMAEPDILTAASFKTIHQLH